MAGMQALEKLLRVIATACLLVVTALLVRREFFSGDVDERQPPVAMQEWEEALNGGQLLGPREASVTILVFADFQCPACRRFAQGPLRSVLMKYPDDVRAVIRHWPLEKLHPHAYQAAVAADCAAQQGRFKALHDLMFDQQTQLGRKDFTELAAEAGVSDARAFTNCISLAGRNSTVDGDIALARRLELGGTPTIAVNGLLYSYVPDTAELLRIITKAVKTSSRRLSQ